MLTSKLVCSTDCWEKSSAGRGTETTQQQSTLTITLWLLCRLIWEMLIYVTEHEDTLTPVWAAHQYLQPRSRAEIYHKVLSAMTSCCMCAICRMIACSIHSTTRCAETSSGMKVILNSCEILESLTGIEDNFNFPHKATGHLIVHVKVLKQE